MTQPDKKAGTPRFPLVAVAYALVLLMALYSLATSNVTFLTNDYRSIVIEAVAVVAGALLGTILLWRIVPAAGRVMLALCGLANIWALVDAGGRRLPAVMGW